MSVVRTRWAAIGAAVAVSLGAGGFGLSQAAVSTGDKPVFVAITPCRLVDTRPGDANIGSRATPLGANDTLTLQVTGSTGQCTDIPAGATAAALNVTAIQGSTRSYLTLYPADASLPNASNLNWNGGDPPTPNKVDVELSPTGAVKITNNTGTVHVAADLVGYYTDHTHDDRYHTKSQVYTKAQIDATRQISRTWYAVSASVLNGKPMSPAFGCMTVGPNESNEQAGTIVLPVDIPAGATITAVDARVLDGSADASYSLAFQRWVPSINGMSFANLRAANGGAASGGQDVALTPAGPVMVADGQTFAVEMSVEAPGSPSERNGLCSVTVDYTLPTP